MSEERPQETEERRPEDDPEYLRRLGLLAHGRRRGAALTALLARGLLVLVAGLLLHLVAAQRLLGLLLLGLLLVTAVAIEESHC